MSSHVPPWSFVSTSAFISRQLRFLKALSVERHGDEVDKLLMEANGEQHAVEFTLDNRRVYIGQVLEVSSSRPEDRVTAILPIATGYRSMETMQIKLTTSYSKLITKLANLQHKGETSEANKLANHWRILIDLDDVKGIRLYDLEAADSMFEDL